MEFHVKLCTNAINALLFCGTEPGLRFPYTRTQQFYLFIFLQFISLQIGDRATDPRLAGQSGLHRYTQQI